MFNLRGLTLPEFGYKDTWTDENGSFHRLDGPSIIHNTGQMSWHVRGIRVISYVEFQALAKLTDEDIAMLILRWGRGWEL